ncbi:MAG: hypothetical protein A2W19_00805 [Spirochaetes bacterium RBG_16_49_21]|nr:MAG: hypothetical protein A2W19_00805 [Spirochaetes bacterium RBG_16_49_21]
MRFFRSGEGNRTRGQGRAAGDLETLLDLLQKGALRPVIDVVYPIEKVREAHRHVETKHSRGKVLVKIGGETGI